MNLDRYPCNPTMLNLNASRSLYFAYNKASYFLSTCSFSDTLDAQCY